MAIDGISSGNFYGYTTVYSTTPTTSTTSSTGSTTSTDAATALKNELALIQSAVSQDNESSSLESLASASEMFQALQNAGVLQSDDASALQSLVMQSNENVSLYSAISSYGDLQIIQNSGLAQINPTMAQTLLESYSTSQGTDIGSIINKTA